MKRITALLLALVMVVAFCVPALAADSTTELIFEYEDPNQNEPSYTITIPDTISLSLEGEAVEIEATEVENLGDGQKLSVTVAKTSNNGAFTLMGANFFAQTYTVTTPDGEVIGNPNDILESQVGKELCSFTGDDTAELIFTAHISYPNLYGTYSGTITFGFEVVDA